MRSIPSPVLSASSEQPMSRTMQYKKVMKPLLERKRRARINQCLEELKELMVSAIQAEGENVSKLEKADVLELTVSHLRKLSQNRQLHLNPSPPPPPQQQVDPAAAVRRFHAGFRRCVQEVDTFFESQRRLASPQAPHHPAARGLMSHLHDCLTVMDAADKTSPIQVVPPVNATAAAAAPPVAYVRHEVSSPPLSPPSAPMAPYQKALSHLRASQQQQEQQQQQQLLLQQQHQPNGLLMPVRVLVRDDKPVESMSMSSLTSPDCGASSSCSEDEGLDLRVGAKRRHLYASSSCYDSSDEDVWRPW